MAGNVWEWVNDWYNPNYYLESPLSNPLGPDTGQNRALRGGSWYSDDYLVRAAARNGYYSSYAVDFVGFRCAMDAK
jgi:iron(II)-dependent oxidoreductase